MSRVNVDHLSGLFSIELVTSALNPLGAEADRTVLVKNFERYLDQAARMFQTTADTHRPPTPLVQETPRRERDDRSREASGPFVAASSEAPSRRTDPADRENEPAAGNTRPSDTDSQTPLQDASKADRETNVSDTGQEASVSDGEPSSNEKEENHEEESIANATQAVEVVNVEPTGDLGDQQGNDGDSRVSDEQAPVSEGQQEAVPSLQRKEASAPAGELEEADPSEDTAGTEESASTPKKDAREAPQVWKEKGSPDESTRQPEGTNGKEDGSGDGNSGKSVAVGAELTGASAPTQDSAGDARRRDGRQGGNRAQAEGAGSDSPTDHPREPEAGQALQNLGVSLPAETTGEPKSEPKGDSTASAPRTSASGVRQVETAGSTRPQPGQGPREASTAPARETPGTDHVDRARFVGRVARAFEAVGERNGSVRLRLHPPELGSLRLEVTVRNGTMAARLEVETHTARTALLDNLPALRDRLAEQHIKVGRFDVDLSDRSLGGSPQQPGDHPHSQHDSRENGAHFGAEPQAERTGPASLSAASQPGQGNQLDVVI